MKTTLFLHALLGIFCISYATFVNTEVERSIDLTSHLAKVKTKITVRFDGSGSSSTYTVLIDPVHTSNLAFLTVKKSEDDDEALPMKKGPGKGTAFDVTLPKALKNGEEQSLVIEEIYSYCQKPYPEEISQNQKQLVKYEGNHLYYSMYVSESQETSVEVASSVIKDYSKLGTTEVEGSTIKYGGSSEYENVGAKSQSTMNLHYENNNPFLAVTHLDRVIEISHWGNIAVEETLEIRHIGAKLKGSFSRFDYQRMPNSGISAVKSFKSILPASASDVYYRDEIGNISTSNLLELDDSVEMEIRPRFPIFGGWKTFYYIGYNLPSYNYLYNRGDKYALRMRFLDHIYDDQVVDDMTLKVILPEGCKQINVDTPYDITREKDSLRFTYLDTAGRPVITMTKKNLVEGHIQDFTLSYKFNKVLLLQEPMLVVSAFFLLFFTVIILVRLDFSITRDKYSEAKMRVQCVIEKVQNEQAKRNKCFNAYSAAIKSYKSSKDAGEFGNARKRAEKTYNETTKSFNNLTNNLKEDGASNEVIEKVTQIIHYGNNLHDKYAHSVTLAEKLVGKRMTKEQYLDHDDKNTKTIDDLQSKIDDLTNNL